MATASAPTPLTVPLSSAESLEIAPKPGSEHTVFLSKVVNHILLLAVDPVLALFAVGTVYAPLCI